jgi:hypothetical protein
MRTYRIVTHEGVELATVRAANLVEAVATAAASTAPVDARIVSTAEGSRVLARLELWAGGHPGWSLAVIP